MAIALADFTDALYSRLTGNSTFNTAMGGTASTAGRIRMDWIEEDSDLPYCAFTIVSSDDWSAGGANGKDGDDVTVQFSIWDKGQLGPRAVAAHLDKLHARLARGRFTPSNQEVLTPLRLQTRGPFKDDLLWRVDADYRFFAFES